MEDAYRYQYKNTPLSKAILGSLFAGIIATVLNLIYSYVYRDISGYKFLGIFTVYTIILFTFVVCLAAGVLYFLLTKHIHSGIIVYIVLFVALTILGLFPHVNFNMTSGQPGATGVHGLTMGIDIITGCTAVFLVPYMAGRPSIWQ